LNDKEEKETTIRIKEERGKEKTKRKTTIVPFQI
jgi:hypothetical protein